MVVKVADRAIVWRVWPRYAESLMKRALVIILIFLAGSLLLAARPSAAADLGLTPNRPQSAHARIWRYTTLGNELPFPRSKRAQAVWNAGACWNDCSAHCAWGLNDCLRSDPQGLCLAYSDACDHYCQRACRSQGGSLLPFE